MHFLNGTRAGALGLMLMLALAGCGDDDSHPADAGPDGGKTDGGRVGADAGDSGITDGGGDASVKTGGSGGRTSGGTGGAPAFQLPMCDSKIPKTAKCGSTTCSASTSMLATAVCSVPCCLPDNTCGFRRTVMDQVTECAPMATADTSCPEQMVMGFGGGMGMGSGGAGATRRDAGADAGGPTILPGCCASSGHCGVISTIDKICITGEPLFLPNLKPGAACGEGPTTDGGSHNDGG
jgi:hypothetical protein